MLLSRDELISALFRETDRAQRMKTPLALILCRMDDPACFEPGCTRRSMVEALPTLIQRIKPLLRCYDSLGQTRTEEFALILPGCNSFNAVSTAQRLKTAVFGTPVTIGGIDLCLTASFGIAGSGGRSSLVVLRNAEQALKSAIARGSGSIERCTYDTEPDSAAFLMPVCGNEALHW